MPSHSLDPDVVALQELGSNAMATQQGIIRTAAYPALHEGVSTGRGIRVGIGQVIINDCGLTN